MQINVGPVARASPEEMCFEIRDFQRNSLPVTALTVRHTSLNALIDAVGSPRRASLRMERALKLLESSAQAVLDTSTPSAKIENRTRRAVIISSYLPVMFSLLR